MSDLPSGSRDVPTEKVDVAPDGANAISGSGVPLEFPSCAVCGRAQVDLICDASEVGAQLQWLRRFHIRRLKPDVLDHPSRAALEDRATFTQGFVTNVVACSVCGLVFRDPRPTPDAVASAYAHDTYGEARLAALFEAQRELYQGKVQALRRWLPTGPRVRVIEVGSFVGGFLAAARDVGWTLRGVDPGQEVVAFSQARGLPVERTTIEQLDVAPATIDCVAIWNTFDQLPDPRSVVEVSARLLRPGGIFAVRVPNGLFFQRVVALLPRAPRFFADALRATLAWNNLLAFPYLYGYSVRTLVRLVAEYDLQPLRVRPDTLVRLSDDATRAWAAVEERVLKLASRIVWTLAARENAADVAPWLDIYFRRESRPR